jgi:hypothetical protein
VTIFGFDIVRDVLPWFILAAVLYMTYLQGRKRWSAWVVGLANQLLWLVFIVATKAWSLLPLNLGLGLWYLYTKNLALWYDEEAQYIERNG